MSLFTYLANKEQEAKKDLDEAKAGPVTHNPIFLVAIASLIGFVVWKASALLTFPFFLSVICLIAYALAVYAFLQFSAMRFGYKLTSERQALLLKDGKVDPGDEEAIDKGTAAATSGAGIGKRD